MLDTLFSKLYKNRFELFFTGQLLILFGALLVPREVYGTFLMPTLFLFSIVSGIILIGKKKFYARIFIAIFFLSLILFAVELANDSEKNIVSLIRFAAYFVFYIIATVEVISQVWNAKFVNKNVVVGLMSGYVSLGLLAFFIFASIELSYPGAFQGSIIDDTSLTSKGDTLLYFGFITLLTIGYGDVVPMIPVAQKATILVGLCGQFYMVIITAVVVQKFMSHREMKPPI
ncbi:two pore domain potassium channel family protein [Tamlana fucoidanivorans]|uniref:Two pore domain potassium channel family protein n=1 Tax=Allotamlana fucoidanivorans TaxID=2583814 RepID=A0A5C4SM79_9FLAO|nr:ion channel [Tamlana fucoidanivorans]TNJ45196.1 two pore domain potassium channel family protein [Tamlana fucoidanivorans]